MSTPAALSRRDWLLAATALAFSPSWAAAPARATQLVSAWQTANEHRIGVLAVEGARWSVQRSLAVPTRAHGLLVEPDGSVLATARRPGDWLGFRSAQARRACDNQQLATPAHHCHSPLTANSAS